MKHYSLFGVLKRNFIWKWSVHKKYSPFWVRYVYAIFNIIGGLISLFIIPFGYECNLSGDIAEWDLRRRLEIGKKEKELKLLNRKERINENNTK